MSTLFNLNFLLIHFRIITVILKDSRVYPVAEVMIGMGVHVWTIEMTKKIITMTVKHNFSDHALVLHLTYFAAFHSKVRSTESIIHPPVWYKLCLWFQGKHLNDLKIDSDEDAEGEYRLQDEENDLINNFDTTNDYWKLLSFRLKALMLIKNYPIGALAVAICKFRVLMFFGISLQSSFRNSVLYR